MAVCACLSVRVRARARAAQKSERSEQGWWRAPRTPSWAGVASARSLSWGRRPRSPSACPGAARTAQQPVRRAAARRRRSDSAMAGGGGGAAAARRRTSASCCSSAVSSMSRVSSSPATQCSSAPSSRSQLIAQCGGGRERRERSGEALRASAARTSRRRGRRRRPPRQRCQQSMDRRAAGRPRRALRARRPQRRGRRRCGRPRPVRSPRSLGTVPAPTPARRPGCAVGVDYLRHRRWHRQRRTPPPARGTHRRSSRTTAGFAEAAPAPRRAMSRSLHATESPHALDTVPRRPAPPAPPRTHHSALTRSFTNTARAVLAILASSAPCCSAWTLPSTAADTK